MRRMPRAPLAVSRSARVLLLAPLLALLLAACAEHRGERRIALHECRLPKFSTAAQCGTLNVAEDRSRPDGRRIGIGVVLLPANTLDPEPDPLFLIPGGPGQSVAALAPLVGAFADVRRKRDLVLVDPRGTGRSAPLDCAALKARDAFDEVVDMDAAKTAPRRCLAELTAQGKIDVTQYTTTAVVADLDEVRVALGYARINLWGGSYGTRVAQEYLRRHADQVRSVVLDGVAPPALNISVDIWPTREAALAGVLAACAADAACREAYPDLRATLGHIRERLGAGRRIAVTDPRTGRAREIALSFDTVVGVLEVLTYSPEISSVIPPLLARAEADDFAPLLAAGMLFTADLAATMNLALHYAVTCAEDAPRAASADAERIFAGLLAPALARRNFAACEGWPRAALPDDFHAPLVSDKPVLLFSGGLDPVTPPAAGELVAKTLSNSRHVIAAGYGHIVSPHACAPQLIEKFIDEAGFRSLPQSCLDYFAASRRPPLFDSLLEAR
jgi:pimeloyl-ACP methyl ester carboxylesterase